MAMVSPGIGTSISTPTWAMIWALPNWAALRFVVLAGATPALAVHIDVVGSGVAAMAPAMVAMAVTTNRGADMAATMAVLAGMAVSSSGGLRGEGDG
jgi:hypothetical protein